MTVKPEAEYIEPWSFTDSVLFTFTIITTIGMKLFKIKFLATENLKKLD